MLRLQKNYQPSPSISFAHSKCPTRTNGWNIPMARENPEIRLIVEQRPLPVFLPSTMRHHRKFRNCSHDTRERSTVSNYPRNTDHYDTGDFPIIVTLIKAERQHAGRGLQHRRCILIADSTTIVRWICIYTMPRTMGYKLFQRYALMSGGTLAFLCWKYNEACIVKFDTRNRWITNSGPVTITRHPPRSLISMRLMELTWCITFDEITVESMFVDSKKFVFVNWSKLSCK